MTTVLVDTNYVALESTKKPVYIQHIVPTTVSTVSENTSFIVQESVDIVLVDSDNIGNIIGTSILGPISASATWTIVHSLNKLFIRAAQL